MMFGGNTADEVVLPEPAEAMRNSFIGQFGIRKNKFFTDKFVLAPKFAG